jgi:acyl-CoA thioesterase-1
VTSRCCSAVFLAVFPFVLACGGSNPGPESAADPVVSPPARTPPARSEPARAADSHDPQRADAPRIVFLGDSLTAGLGLDVDRSFPSLIQKRLDREGYAYVVVNAGVSGDTSAGGLRRLEWAMSEGTPKALIVALGGNDGLRGLPPEQLEQNLATIIERGQSRGATVILAGMEAPPNFGADYTARFRAVYPALAQKYKVTLIPFILQGVAGDGRFNQADGIHPNERGAQIIADMVWQVLEPVLQRPTSPK